VEGSNTNNNEKVLPACRDLTIALERMQISNRSVEIIIEPIRGLK
jgi:hypothetical protein